MHTGFERKCSDMPHKKKEAVCQKNKQHVMEVVQAASQSKTDPFGSYTGKPVKPTDTPVQDADDL